MAWVSVLALGFWVGGVQFGESLARRAEEDPGIYLWGEENWLVPLTASQWRPRRGDKDRLLVLGPSEVREGVLIDVLAAALDRPVSLVGLSMGTINDARVLLDLVESRYGSAAVPEEILLGVSTRFLLNAAYAGTPFLDAIDRYSEFRVERAGEVPRLVPKDSVSAVWSRLRWIGHQGHRYREAVRFFGQSLVNRWSSLGADFSRYRPPRYHSRSPRNKKPFFEFARTGLRSNPNAFYFYEPLRTMDPAAHAAAICRRFEGWVAQCRKLGIRLRIVNLPEGPWAEEFYAPGRYEDYEALLAGLTADLAFFDARHLLSGDQFYDWNHPTRDGAERLTEHLITFLHAVDGLREPGQPQ